MRFHDLRHTANTRMMLAGVLQEIRREIIGHSSQRSRDVNDRYTQIELPEKREAIVAEYQACSGLTSQVKQPLKNTFVDRIYQRRKAAGRAGRLALIGCAPEQTTAVEHHLAHA